MKAKVIKKFRDKYTGEIYKPGEVIKISKKRFEEIQTVGNFVEEVKAEVEEVKAETAETEE